MLALHVGFTPRTKPRQRATPFDVVLEGACSTSFRPNDVVTEIRIPLPSGEAGGSYHKLERKVGDFATVAVSVQVELDGRKVKTAGIGLTSVGATNIKAKKAEQSLSGRELTDDVIAEAARLAATEAEPKDDIRGTAAYKKDVVRVFVQRGLKAAFARAQEVKA